MISSALIISATLFYVIFDFGQLDLDLIKSPYDSFSDILLMYLILFAVIFGVKFLFIKKSSFFKTIYLTSYAFTLIVLIGSLIGELNPRKGNDIKKLEQNIDHAGIIEALDEESLVRGSRIYNNNCINCHGHPDVEGSLPNASKFWEPNWKTKSDPFSMYQTLTQGIGAMPAQLKMTPREKYDVIHYIRNEFV